MRLCNETLTLVHPCRTKMGDSYLCTVIHGASWYAKTAVRLQDGGLCADNMVQVRIPQESLRGSPAAGDLLVRGIITEMHSVDDLSDYEIRKIVSVGDNRRGLTPHWAVIGA